MGLDYNKVNTTSNNYKRMREFNLCLGKLSFVLQTNVHCSVPQSYLGGCRPADSRNPS